MTKRTDIAELLVDASTLGALVGCSRQRIGQLAADGTLSRTAGNKYKLGDSIARFIGYPRAEGRRSTQSAAESRVRDARAAEIELRTAERRRQVIAADESIAMVDAIIGAVRTAADGIGARCTRDRDMRHKIESEVDDMLKAASDSLEKWAAELEAGA